MNEKIDFKFFSTIFKEGGRILYLTRKILFLLLSFFIIEKSFEILNSFFIFKKIYYDLTFKNYFFKTSTFNLKSAINISFISSSFPSFFLPIPFKILTILSILFVFKIFFFIYHKEFPEDLKEIKTFLRSNFLPFILCNTIFLVFNIFRTVKFNYPIEINTKIILKNYIIYLISLYPHTLLLATINSLIFYFFNITENHLYNKNTIYCLKYVKEFFILQFIFVGLYNILFFPILFQSKIPNFYYRFLNFYPVIYVIFFLVPPLIVIEDLNWYSFFKRNFEVLKRNKRIILIYFLVIFTLNFLFQLMKNFKRAEILNFLYLLLDKSFHYYILATTFIFCKKILNSE